ncbi:MAG: L,D-transpeptidase family protein [Fibrobacterota bacterium]|nr:MAG: L,D-transpeptidase family protein [Fibrobacterota bacterium]
MLSAFLSCVLALPGSNNLSGFHLRVEKEARRMLVMEGRDTLKVYQVALGSGAADAGTKLIRGDHKTPEGVYIIRSRNPNSSFYKSFLIDYPSVTDAKRGLEGGVIKKSEYLSILQAHRDGKLPPQRTALGGDICIHGGYTEADWTWGCVAVGNEGMDSLWGQVKVGTKVEIVP